MTETGADPGVPQPGDELVQAAVLQPRREHLGQHRAASRVRVDIERDAKPRRSGSVDPLERLPDPSEIALPDRLQVRDLDAVSRGPNRSRSPRRRRRRGRRPRCGCARRTERRGQRAAGRRRRSRPGRRTSPADRRGPCSFPTRPHRGPRRGRCASPSISPAVAGPRPSPTAASRSMPKPTSGMTLCAGRTASSRRGTHRTSTTPSRGPARSPGLARCSSARPGSGGRRGRVAAVADDLRGHALAERVDRARIGRQGEVAVRVDVDVAGREHEPIGIDDPRAPAGRIAIGATIRPPAMATSPRRGAEPSPSWIVAPRKTVSIIAPLARSIHEPAAVDVDGGAGHVGRHRRTRGRRRRSRPPMARRSARAERA